MTYQTDDESVHDGNPVELFEFTGPTAALTYHYTSYTESVTYDSDTYLPEPMMRSSIDIESGGDVPEVLVEMPSSLNVVLEYGVKIPPRTTLLTIWRRHTPTGAVTKYWEGVITSISIVGNKATFRTASTLDDAAHSKIPSSYFQALCNHMLYDDMCQVARGSYDQATTVASLSGDTVTVNSVGGQPNNYFKAGEIVRDVDGERRLILQQIGTVLTINKAFRTLAATNAVTLYAGCTHAIAACKTKFSNVANFGGHPNMPEKDPYIVGFDNLKE
jgi:uncharacterized phage protein (TIGR02218 family)